MLLLEKNERTLLYGIAFEVAILLCGIFKKIILEKK